MSQIQVLGKANAMNFLTRAAIVTYDISNMFLVQLFKHFNEFAELNTCEIASVPVAANTLIRRVHVNQVLPGRMEHNIPIVFGRK